MKIKTEIDKLLELYELPLAELIEKAAKVTEENFDNGVEFCSIISAKTGKCSENCRYCAQSSHHRTNIETHPLVAVEDVIKSALSAKDSGVNRFAIVTSGKTPDENDFPSMLEMIKAISKVDGISACASIGILNEDQVIKLKEAGLKRYHHNINTCKSYHDSICTSHSYQDRINTINLVRKHGIEVCCGAIIGMGESRQQRVELALELKEINPISSPINFLDPIEGTPFENYKDKIDEEEIVRTLAILRIALPKVVIRYAGGRLARLSKENQELGIKSGVNGILVGNLLTTIGITPQEDVEMIERQGKFLVK